MIHQLPVVFPEWVAVFNRSRSRQEEALHTRWFQNALWGALTKSLPAHEVSTPHDGTQWGDGCETETFSTPGCHVSQEQRRAVRGFKFRGDVGFCWPAQAITAMTCCRLGCMGASFALHDQSWQAKICCSNERVVQPVPDRTCLQARSLLPVWPAIRCWHRFSQGWQDSILAFLISELGSTNRFFVEIGFNQGSWEDDQGSGPNTRLLHQSGWNGLLFDNMFHNISMPLHKHEVTMENVVSLLERYGAPLEPDYVSIDIDGCDLWIFLGLTRKFRPRVVSVEYNANMPLGKLRTTDCVNAQGREGPIDKFACQHSLLGPGTYENICGASLHAIAKAAEMRGYVLIWVEPLLDAFLVREDLLCPGQKPPLSSFAHAVGLRMHSPPYDPTREQRWVIDFEKVSYRYE